MLKQYLIVLITLVVSIMCLIMDKIENMEQYQWAVNRVEELLPLVDDSTPLDDANSVELEKLSNLVADYSDLHFAIGTPTLSEILKLRMEEMGLSVAKLAKILGVTPLNVKAYLSGSEEPPYVLVVRVVAV